MDSEDRHRIAGESGRVAPLLPPARAVGPQSDLLSRVASFLPQIQRANQSLLIEQSSTATATAAAPTATETEPATTACLERSRAHATANRSLQIDLDLHSDDGSTSESDQCDINAEICDFTARSLLGRQGSDSDVDEEEENRCSSTSSRIPTKHAKQGAASSDPHQQQHPLHQHQPATVIQLQFAVGPVEDNPVIQWLACETESDSDQDVHASARPILPLQQDPIDRAVCVFSELAPSGIAQATNSANIATIQTTADPPLITAVRTKRKSDATVLDSLKKTKSSS